MKESKIKDLFNNENTVYFFDVDGVLVSYDFGEYNHNFANDETWEKAISEINFYANKRPINTFQKFLADKNMERVYVLTKVSNTEEESQKKELVYKNYGIKGANVLIVLKNEDKLTKMMEIKKKYPSLEDKYFVMIDDSVEVLNWIMEHSNFSTVHVSSFIS